MKQLNSYILSFDSTHQQISRIKKRIENSLNVRQNIVGGPVAIYPLTDSIDIIYCEDFSKLDKQNAWIIYNEQGDEQLVLYGTILCLRYQKDEYVSLTLNDYDTINTLITPISVFNTEIHRNGRNILYKKC